MRLLNVFQILLKYFFESLGTIIKILILSRSNKIASIKITEKELVILGNGPSLKEILTYKSEFLKGKSTICVNHFAESESYTIVKPDFYILGAPEMWRSDVEDSHLQKGKKLFSEISIKTDWALKLFISSDAKKYSDWISKIQDNQNIEIIFYNSTPSEGFAAFQYFTFRNNLAMPRPHNILIPSLILGLNLGFKSIFITGADHSWMKDVVVSKDNKVFLTQKHFYDVETAKPNTMDKGGKGERKMHEVLEKWMYAFKSYFIIQGYAESRNQKIINITPNSFIDAFERDNIF